MRYTFQPYAKTPLVRGHLNLGGANPQGGRKGVSPAMAYRCLLNKADDDARRAMGQEIQALLAQQGIFSAITYYTEEERGGLCLF